jgi:hypothetical protein
MIFSGNISRSVYPTKSGFSWSMFLSPSNYGKDFSVSFLSNSGGNFSVSVSGQEVYFGENSFGGMPLEGVGAEISGNSLSGKHDLFVNGEPLFLGYSQPFDYVTGVGLSSTGELDFDFFFSSKQPEYAIEDQDSFYSGEGLAAKIVNLSDSPFVVFSGAAQDQNWRFSGPLNLTIPPHGTGSLFFESSFFPSFSSSFPVDLFTNFGDLSFEFNAQFLSQPDKFFFIQLGPEISELSDGFDITLTNSFYNFQSGSNLVYKFEYFSGITGQYYGFIQVSNPAANRPVSGLISGEGFLTGSGTGAISRFNEYTQAWETGVGSGTFSQFKIASGNFSREYSFDVFTLGSGRAPVLVPASGAFSNVAASGFVSRAQRCLEVSGITGWMTGRGDLIEVQIDSSGNINPIFEEFYSSGSGVGKVCPNVDFNSIPVYYDFAQVGEIIQRDLPSSVFYGTGTYSKFLVLTGAAPATGKRISGKILGDFSKNYEPGLWTFSRWGRYVGSLDSSGSAAPEIITGFNPVTFEGKELEVSGILEGLAQGTFVALGCDFDVPTMKITGRAFGNIYFDENKDPVVIYERFSPQVPSTFSGEHYLIDNSDYLINSGNFLGEIPWSKKEQSFDEEGNPVELIYSGVLNVIDSESLLNQYGGTPTGGRIRISRLGNTASGSGWFLNPVSTPELGSNVQKSGASGRLAGWTETFQVESGFFQSSLEKPDLSFIVSDIIFDGPDDVSHINFTVDAPGVNITNINFGEFEGFFNSKLCIDLEKSKYFCKTGQSSFAKIGEFSIFEPVGAVSYDLPSGGKTFLVPPTGASGLSPLGESGLFFSSGAGFFEMNCSGSGCTGVGPYYSTFKSGLVLTDNFSNALLTGFSSGSVVSRYSYVRNLSFACLVSGKVLVESPNQSLAFSSQPFGISGPNLEYSWEGFVDFNDPNFVYFSHECSGSGCVGTGSYSGSYLRNKFAGGVEKCVYSGEVIARSEFGARNSIGSFKELSKVAEVNNSVFGPNTSADFSEYSNGNPPLFEFPLDNAWFVGNSLFGISTGQDGNFWSLSGSCLGGGCGSGQMGSITGTVSGRYSGHSGVFSISGGVLGGEAATFQQLLGMSSGEIWARDCVSGILSGNGSEKLCSDCQDYSSYLSGDDRPILSFNPVFELEPGVYSGKIGFESCDRAIGPVGERNLFGFSHLNYTFCEKDRVGIAELRKTGQFEASGLIKLGRCGLDYVDSKELMPSGYGTLLPFYMGKDDSIFKLSFPLEDEGDIEDDEFICLTMVNLSFSNNQRPVQTSVINSKITILDDNNPFSPFPCFPTLPSEKFGCCWVDSVCYNYPESSCQAINGFFSAEDSMCLSHNQCVWNPPPEPVEFGACCVGEDCSYSTKEDCDLAGGTFHKGAFCWSVDCSSPVGCCCSASVVGTKALVNYQSPKYYETKTVREETTVNQVWVTCPGTRTDSSSCSTVTERVYKWAFNSETNECFEYSFEFFGESSASNPTCTSSMIDNVWTGSITVKTTPTAWDGDGCAIAWDYETLENDSTCCAIDYDSLGYEFVVPDTTSVSTTRTVIAETRNVSLRDPEDTRNTYSAQSVKTTTLSDEVQPGGCSYIEFFVSPV